MERKIKTINLESRRAVGTPRKTGHGIKVFA